MSQVAMNVARPVESAKQKMVRLRQALLEAVTPEDVSTIAQKMLEKAKEGSVAAAKLVFGYVFGRPDKAVSFHLARGCVVPETAEQRRWITDLAKSGCGTITR